MVDSPLMHRSLMLSSGWASVISLRRIFTSTGQRKVMEVLRACIVLFVVRRLCLTKDILGNCPTPCNYNRGNLCVRRSYYSWSGYQRLTQQSGDDGLVESSVQKKTPTHFWIGVVLEDAVVLSHDGAILLEVYYSLEIGSDSDLLGDGESHEFRSSQKFPSGIPLCTLFGIGEVAIEKGDDCVPWVHITWRRRVFVRRRHRSNGRRRIPMS